MAQELEIWIDVFPVARTPVPWMLPAQDNPAGLLVLIVTKFRLVVPLDGRASTLIPPQGLPPVVCPGPFPLTDVFLMSKAAPLSSMPPPGLLVTAQVSMWRVTVEPGSGAALMPIPVCGLALPWIFKLRR